MLNAAIVILSVVICIFQPWMAVIFALFWLINLKSKKEHVQQQSNSDYFAQEKAKAFKELEAKIDAINAEYDDPDPEPKKEIPDYMRVVK